MIDWVYAARSRELNPITIKTILGGVAYVKANNLVYIFCTLSNRNTTCTTLCKFAQKGREDDEA